MEAAADGISEYGAPETQAEFAWLEALVGKGQNGYLQIGFSKVQARD